MQIVINPKKRISRYWAMLAVYPNLLDALREKITDELPLNDFDYFGMTISDFLHLTEKQFPAKIQKQLKSRFLTVEKYIKILNTFENGNKKFEQAIEETTIEKTANEKEAENGLLPLSVEESMLNFMVESFHLQGWEAAQKMTIYEYLSARKKSYNNAMYQKRMAEIQKAKL